MLRTLERQSGRLAERLAFIGVLGVLAIALMIVGDVLLRWLFSAPIRGMNEVVEIMLAVAIAAVDSGSISCRCRQADASFHRPAGAQLAALRR